ncbi:MAG: hypothetical protein KatS3mg082_0634 [Nitrospiraceae bacterium]|nr:MAG: hypothetical protein KatS3mg082_0634 [Nitrospiraceae bacterium]
MEESILEDARRFLKGDERGSGRSADRSARAPAAAGSGSGSGLSGPRRGRAGFAGGGRDSRSVCVRRSGTSGKASSANSPTNCCGRVRRSRRFLDDLRRERTAQRAKEAKRRLAELEERERARPAAQSDPVPVEQLHAGDRVELLSIGTTGVLLESPLGKKRVRVKVGRRWKSRCRSPVWPVSTHRRRRSWLAANGARTTNPLGATAYPARDMPAALDVRGKAADEALDLLIAGLGPGGRCAGNPC